MQKEETKLNKLDLALIIPLTIIAIGLVVVASHPKLRGLARSVLLNDSREILASIEGSVSATGPRVKVLKIRSGSHIELEVYNVDSPEQPKVIGKFQLGEWKDGYLQLAKQSSNLALSDTDKDGYMEILCPVFDDKMNPRLLLFKYNSSTSSYEPMTGSAE